MKKKNDHNAKNVLVKFKYLNNIYYKNRIKKEKEKVESSTSNKSLLYLT